MISALALFIVTLQVAANVTGGSTDTLSGTGDPASVAEGNRNHALTSIKDAELSGADVSAMVDKFNLAIGLQEQAVNSQFESCPSYSECFAQANEMLLSIVDDASSLTNQAIAKKEQESVMLFAVYVPISSFVASVTIVAAYRAWKSWRAKRFESLNIRDKRPS